ncbi:MAG TPA: hypothetical protein VGK20_05850 [Candidatus Binatia bacterium]|jgi:hypothetical protein
MSFDFVLTLAAMCVISLAMFVIPAVPVWVWGILLFSYAMTQTYSLDADRMTAPHDEEERCRRKCEDVYGTDHRYFLTRQFCIDRCDGRV